MTNIKIDIKEEDMEKFLKELVEFCRKENIPEEDIKIENLTVLQYVKHFIIDSE